MITRSKSKKIRKYSKIMAALIIQKNYRKYINNRYKSLITNYDDIDIITQSPIKLISRYNLLISNNKGYNGIEFLKWINTYDIFTQPKHPLHLLDISENDMRDIVEFGKNMVKYQQNSNYNLLLLYNIIHKEIQRRNI